MGPIKFDGANVVFGADQPEYIPLPAFYDKENGEVVTCWKITPEELEQIKKTGVVWLSIMTFNQPLMPVLLSANEPEMTRTAANGKD